MYIDMFVERKIAIHVSCLNNLDQLERESDTALGHHPSNGRFADGFEDYCRKQLDHVKRDRGATGIYVCLNIGGTSYGYMTAGTTFLQNEYGMDIIPAEEVLDELRQIADHLEEDFFELLK